MNPITPDQLLASLQWRYATKVFDPAQTIPAATWSALERSLVLAPSSYGLQPGKFLVVTDRALRERLLPVSWNQRQVTDCSHLVVFVARTEMREADVQRLIDRTAAVRGVPAAALDGYRKLIIGDLVQGPRASWAKEWAIRQSYLAIGQLLASCAVLGIDACPMEGFDPGKYDEILGLTGTGYTSAVVCATGYRASDDKYAKLAKIRFPEAELIEHR